MAVRLLLALGCLVVSQAALLQLFMDPDSDPQEPWGLITPAPTKLLRNTTMRPPPCNYSAGATVFASFSTSTPGEYEVFVAVGRPGEPLTTAAPAGVSVDRYVTTNFVEYSSPITVLFLPNGSPAANDQNIWTVKSMDRNHRGYLLLAFYGDSCTAFGAPLELHPNSFRMTQPGGVFRDHDDTNLIWSTGTAQWVDMQITGAPWLDPRGAKTICPHNLSDNGGCNGGPRVVTVRTSTDGRSFSGNLGCADPPPNQPFNSSDRLKCKTFNESGLIRPDPSQDPPELQFYRIRPFYVGESGRLAAHVLQYAASPAEVNNVSKYGYWGPYCPNAQGGFDMCHKGHGYGLMHGPHIMEEWWVGSRTQQGPEELDGWKRPFKRFRAAPHDVWLMSQPVSYQNAHLWVADTGVFSAPLYRIAGLYAPANGEFNSEWFVLGAEGVGSLWLNVAAKWEGNLVTGGCDEGCGAYVMAELQDATGLTVAGFERGNCILMDVDTLKAPLVWSGSPTAPPTGTRVRVRFFFRDATIYAFGS